MIKPACCVMLFVALLWAQSRALVSVDASGPKEPAELPKPKAKTPLQWTMVENCAKCHRQAAMNPTHYTIAFGETKIWEAHDRHKDAWNVLNGERAQQMARILRYPVAADARCVSCHGGLDLKGEGKMEVLKEFGVNCAICHGPFKEWYDAHQGPNEAWRKLARAEKDKYWGMYDLWDAGRRAEICASCHIGNVEQGKVVTHEMYAAGHPPLPGFEPATFSQQMPPHWLSLKEKQQAQKEGKIHPRTLDILGVTPAEIDLELVHHLGIGALGALRATGNLIGDQARLGKDSWPELAVFDCYACHHDLQNPSWRQERGYVGTPGRPQMRPWSGALLTTGLAHAVRGKDEFLAKYEAEAQNRLLQLAKAFDARPFGEPAFVTKAAAEMSSFLDRVIADADPRRADYPKNHVRQLLGRLEPAAKRTPDFDSARQLSWAFHVLHGEGYGGAAFKKDAADAWGSLEKNLSLKLPIKGVPITEMEKGDKHFYLEAMLDRLNTYQPREFRADFATILKAIGK